MVHMRSKMHFQEKNKQEKQTMKRVLLVDDNEALLFAFKRLSLSYDISVEIASSLELALYVLSRGHFDVVIADLNMTGVATHEGYEIIKAAKRNNQNLRAFIWTAYDEGKMLREQAAKVGVEGVLTKPITFNTLLSVIKGEDSSGVSCIDRSD
jgi:two-component system, NtrC family, response regulator HydG